MSTSSLVGLAIYATQAKRVRLSTHSDRSLKFESSPPCLSSCRQAVFGRGEFLGTPMLATATRLLDCPA